MVDLSGEGGAWRAEGGPVEGNGWETVATADPQPLGGLPQRIRPDRTPYLLFQEGPPQGDPLLQFPQLPLVLRLGLHLDLALVGVEQPHLLLQLQPQGLAFCFLSLV